MYLLQHNMAMFPTSENDVSAALENNLIESFQYKDTVQGFR